MPVDEWACECVADANWTATHRVLTLRLPSCHVLDNLPHDPNPARVVVDLIADDGRPSFDLVQIIGIGRRWCGCRLLGKVQICFDVEEAMPGKSMAPLVNPQHTHGTPR